MKAHRIRSIALGTTRVALMLLIAQAARPAAAESITLDYSTLTGLPDTTGQGLVYYSSAVATESNTVSVANQALHINTSQYGSDVYAYYQANNAYNSALDAEMIFTVKITAANGIGMLFTYYDGSYSGSIAVSTGGWYVYGNGSSGTIDNTTYHTYDLKTFAATHTFSLSIDGTVVKTGSQTAGGGSPSAVYFGDGTTSGGNVTGDLSYFSFNNPTAVPEPASLAMLGLGLLASAGLARRRSSKRAASGRRAG